MGMREVRVTGGFSDVLVTGVGDVLGEDLSGATVSGALWPEGETWPPDANPVWKATTGELTASGGEVAMSVTSSQTPGHFHWWLKVQLDTLLVVLRVRDPDNPDEPWHIYVH